MSDWRIAVPSSGRTGTIVDKTLPMLLAGGVPFDRVDVWVRSEEARAYGDAILAWMTARPDVPPGLTVVPHDSPPGVRAARNAIARGYPVGTRVVSCDDDVSELIHAIDTKTVEPVASIPDLIERGYQIAADARVNLWGIYPVRNPYFMRPRVRLDLTYVVGCFFGVTVRNDPCELVDLDDKEDFERSIRFYLRDGGVARIEDVSLVTAYYREPGGMQQYRTEETVREGARRLAEMYPDLAHPFVSKAGHHEVRLRDSRIRRRRG